MNRCLCLVYISSCMFLSLDRRAVQAHSAQGKTSVTGANMSNYSTLLPKAESTGPTVHIISASTGAPFSNPTACPRFHASSFIGGMVLAFIILLLVTLGYRLACSPREVRYRVMLPTAN
ncbi:uncharacterized protein tmem123 isoform X2 [Puntigrus tetrazona]|uniref:uncharacterized protein tmem123 isoform X2 n=1 Tax=Puntigrus tetrazona TaxID=1606681 RepID=UPI001C89D49B|nr:uncharacterized protein tmem123 isoform X2 [Puntigrus tetrazona]